MTDPRVRRGITVSSVHSTYIETTPEEFATFKREPKRSKESTSAIPRPTTPEAVQGRQHMEIQTENFLEELTDRPVEKDRETQTDVFLDRPPSPLFVPKKSGVDISTQILPGELFDFDKEVEPILSQLIAKTLEQSLMEVRDEEELRNLKIHQEAMSARRAAELAETQRMEELEKKREEEKQRRLQQEKDRVVRENQIKEKVAAREFAKQYLESLTPNVFNKLSTMGYFYDPVVKEVESTFFPWLVQASAGELDKSKQARQLLEEMVKYSLQKAVTRYHNYQALIKKREEEEKLRQQAELEEAAKKAQMQKDLEQQLLSQLEGEEPADEDS